MQVWKNMEQATVSTLRLYSTFNLHIIRRRSNKDEVLRGWVDVSSLNRESGNGESSGWWYGGSVRAQTQRVKDFLNGR